MKQSKMDDVFYRIVLKKDQQYSKTTFQFDL